jgi:hypothetical protein
MSRVRCTLALSFLLVLASSAPAWAQQKIPVSKFMPSRACMCHNDRINEWGKSMHAQAVLDPLYRAKRADADKATGGALSPFCDACHSPIAVMGGQAAAIDKASEQAKESVTCDFCHQVSGTRPKLGTSSYVVSPDGTKRAQIKDPVAYVHKAQYSKHHESAEFCGMCHNVDHPVNGMHLEATYSEWKASGWAKQGVTCQDCHMTPGPGVTKPNPGKAAIASPDRPHIYTMTFAGGNVALGDSAKAEANLKAAAELKLEVPEVVAAGSKAKAKATITNVGAGHHLPTGLTEVRQMWLEVKAIDGVGKELLSKKKVFATELKDAKGNHPVELWDAVGIYSDVRIPAGKSDVTEAEFDMPASGPVKVTAALYYRSASEEMAKKAKVDVPTTTMASTETAVYATAAEAAKGKSGPARSQGCLGMVLLPVMGLMGVGLASRRRRIIPGEDSGV